MSRHTRETETGKEKGEGGACKGEGCVCVCVCARFPVLLSAFCFQLWLPSSPKLKCLNTLPFSTGPSSSRSSTNRGTPRGVGEVKRRRRAGTMLQLCQPASLMEAGACQRIYHKCDTMRKSNDMRVQVWQVCIMLVTASMYYRAGPYCPQYSPPLPTPPYSPLPSLHSLTSRVRAVVVLWQRPAWGKLCTLIRNCCRLLSLFLSLSPCLPLALPLSSRRSQQVGSEWHVYRHILRAMTKEGNA